MKKETLISNLYILIDNDYEYSVFAEMLNTQCGLNECLLRPRLNSIRDGKIVNELSNRKLLRNNGWVLRWKSKGDTINCVKNKETWMN